MSPDTRDEPRDQPDDLSLALSEDMLAAEYVLGTLDARRAQRRPGPHRSPMPPSPPSSGRWERRLGELHVLTADMEPPPAVWDAIKEKLARDRTERDGAPAGPDAAAAYAIAATRGDPKRPGPAGAGGALAHACVFTGSLAAALLAFILVPRWAPGLLPRSLYPKPPCRRQSPSSPDRHPRLRATSRYFSAMPCRLPSCLSSMPSAHSLTLRRVGAPREPGKSYELWLISSRFPAPRSLGLAGPGDVTELTDVLADDPGPDRRRELRCFARTRRRLAHGGAVERGVFRQADGGERRRRPGAPGAMKKTRPGEARFWGGRWGGYWVTLGGYANAHNATGGWVRERT